MDRVPRPGADVMLGLLNSLILTVQNVIPQFKFYKSKVERRSLAKKAPWLSYANISNLIG